MGDSRLRLQPLSAPLHPDREIYIGWDSVLHTYFAQVIDGLDDEGEDILTVDLGNDVGEISTAAEAIDTLRPYAEIPDDLHALLERTKVADTATVSDLTTNPLRPTRGEQLGPTLGLQDKPDGEVTALQRSDVEPVLSSNHWTFDTIHATDSGYTEVFLRGAQVLELHWDWSPEDNAPRLLSPVTLGDQHHGVGSADELASLLIEGGSDLHRTPAEPGEERADQATNRKATVGGADPVDLHTGTPAATMGVADHEDETLFGDEGSHMGMGL